MSVQRTFILDLTSFFLVLALLRRAGLLMTEKISIFADLINTDYRTAARRGVHHVKTTRMHKAGFVNIVGNPNVGKSTLMNQLVWA